MKSLHFAFLLLFLFACNTLSAQQHPTATGRVMNAEGEPLPGAALSVSGHKESGTITDAEGNYTLRLPGNGVYNVIASYMGYRSQEKRITAGKEKKQNFYLSENAVGLETVVVTGTRTPKLLKDAPIITRVISASDIEKVNVNHIGQLLQTELPGIEFSYSMDQQVSINMQGFGGQSVLFLVDGERLAGETLNNVDYNRLNLDNVQRVEIIKGAASTLYGSNAVGGVINMITRAPEETWKLNFNTRFAEHNDERYGGTLGFKAGKLHSQSNVQYTDKNTFNVANGSFRTVYGNRTWNFKQRFVYTPTEKLKLTARAGYYFRQRKKEGDSKDRYRDFSGSLKADYDFSRNSRMELSYIFDQYDKSDYLPLTRKDIRDYSNVQHSTHMLYHHTWQNKNILTVGSDYMRDYLLSYQFALNRGYTMHSADAFAQFDWNPTEHLNAIMGLRYDYFSRSNVSNLSPHIGLMYKTGRCSLRGSYSQGFRSPSLKEMYMDFFMANTMMIYGNTDLKAETSHNFALSAEYTQGRCNLSICGYYNIIRNRIGISGFRDTNGRIAQCYVNEHKIDITGIDVNASVKYPCGLGARFSYGYLHEIVPGEQSRLSSTRPHSATVRIEYGKTWKKYSFNLSLDGKAVSKVKTNQYKTADPADGTEPVTYNGYSMWNLILTQRVKQGVSLNIAVNNLFNYTPRYYSFNSPYTKGTHISMGVSVDVDKLVK